MTPPEFNLSRDPFGRMVLVDAEGHRHVGIEPVRAFPISNPKRWISLCDAEGREILALPDLEVLPDAVRRPIEEELALREFVPLVRRIVQVSVDTFPADWDVLTDRGPTRFTIDNEDDVRRLGPAGVMITDARRIRYQIPDVSALDGQSRRLLERFL